jgi:hypothetical protein
LIRLKGVPQLVELGSDVRIEACPEILRKPKCLNEGDDVGKVFEAGIPRSPRRRVIRRSASWTALFSSK